MELATAFKNDDHCRRVKELIVAIFGNNEKVMENV
jgi:hypothetical protein